MERGSEPKHQVWMERLSTYEPRNWAASSRDEVERMIDATVVVGGLTCALMQVASLFSLTNHRKTVDVGTDCVSATRSW